MDPSTHTHLSSFFGDLAEILGDIIPNKLSVVRLLDQWCESPEKFDTRMRIVEFGSKTHSNNIKPLCEDTAIVASGDGWLLVEQEDKESHYILERGDEVLTIAPALDNRGCHPCDTMQIKLQQAWPSDVHPPVDSTRTFVDVCQKVLKIHDFPVFVEKDIFFDLGEPKAARWLQEKIRFKTQDNIRARAHAANYLCSPNDDFVWHQNSEQDNHRLRACIIIDDKNSAVDLTLIRESKRLSSLN